MRLGCAAIALRLTEIGIRATTADVIHRLPPWRVPERIMFDIAREALTRVSGSP